jgi:hypothetical protein
MSKDKKISLTLGQKTFFSLIQHFAMPSQAGNGGLIRMKKKARAFVPGKHASA